jgi:hypothetical protein
MSNCRSQFCDLFFYKEERSNQRVFTGRMMVIYKNEENRID